MAIPCDLKRLRQFRSKSRPKGFLRIALLQVAIAMCIPAIATGDGAAIGASNSAMGGTDVAHVNLFSAANNQGALGFLNNSQFGLFAEQRFAGLGLGRYAAAGALVTNSGNFAITADYFGYELYNDTRVGVAFGRTLGKYFSAGFQVNYVGTNIPEYGSASTVMIELGLLARLSSKWSIGAHVSNPTQATIGALEEELPSIFSLGVGFRSSEKVFLTAEVEKDIDFKPNFQTGLNYKLNEMVSLRGGFASNPAILSFGVGFKVSNLVIDVASTFHNMLGPSPQLSFIYEVGKK